MSTSNLAKAIGMFTIKRHLKCYLMYAHILDSAFVDRADIIQYVDLPPRDAVYDILRSCLAELVTKGIISEIVSLYNSSTST